jgi:hypothetical protein
VNVRRGTFSVDFGQFVENELSKSLNFLRVAVDDRSAGNVTAARREELAAHRAYHEALYLFTLLRSRISGARTRRVAIRIREIERAMQSV